MVPFPSSQNILCTHVITFPVAHPLFLSELLDKYHPVVVIYYTFSSCSPISSSETSLTVKVTF